MLVYGELLAFGAAIAAIPVELVWSSVAPWLVIGAAIAGTAALLWYAIDLISTGEQPLTNRSAHTIRQVVQAMEMEKEGAVFFWEQISPDGGIPSDMSNWSRLRPDLRQIMEREHVDLLEAIRLQDDRNAREGRDQS